MRVPNVEIGHHQIGPSRIDIHLLIYAVILTPF